MPSSTHHALLLPELTSYIATQRTPTAELSRQMLLQACHSEDGVLRSGIESGDPSVLKLYRGVSASCSRTRASTATLRT